MSDRFENINLWEDKLQQISLPDLNKQWCAMEMLLDEKMPVIKKGHLKTWLLLIMLLLLLIGVCNCPAVFRGNKFFGNNNLPAADQAITDKNESNRKAAASSDMKDDNSESKSKPEKINSSTESNKNIHSDDKEPNTNKNDEPIIVSSSKATGNNYSTKEKTNQNKMSNQQNSLSNNISNNSVANSFSNKNFFKSATNKKRNHQSAKKNKLIADSEKTIDFDQNKSITSNKENQEGSIENQKSIIPIGPDSAVAKKNNHIDSLKKNRSVINAIIKKQKDSSAKKKIVADSIEDAKGFLIALGLNQFFAVGGQQKSNYNSNGTSGSIGDYIPVPVARYYFHKWLYVQMEAQFNTPQYTKTLLAGFDKGADTVNSLFIKKLFYFNIPLSVHFSPIKNLYVGAGLQYSLLTNGVALSQQSKTIYSSNVITNVLAPTDTSYISSKIENFKSTSTYKELKTSEFRFLLDINYQWKPITLGLRYNRSFTDFINVRISNSIITQAHNSSLQLYLRYMLWNNLKKIKLPPR